MKSKNANMKLTREEASKALAGILSKSPLLTPIQRKRDVKEIEEGVLFDQHLNTVSFHFEVPEVWGAEATLTIDGWEDGVNVSWSSTTRTVAMSLITLDLYQKVTLLASHVEAFIHSVTITDLPKA